MNLFLNHKFQAFYYTSFLFLLLFYGFLHGTSWLKISPQQQESFNLAIQQFITQSEQSLSPATQHPIQSKPKKQENTLKKSIKKQTLKPLPKPQQSSTIFNSKSSLSDLTSKDAIETLTFNKDNHPFLKAVKQAIDANINYPRQARKMRIQGEVIVEFLWTRQKVLKDLKVNKSSGYIILDESALRTIQKASLYFPQHSNDAYLQIPIIFTLRS